MSDSNADQNLTGKPKAKFWENDTNNYTRRRKHSGSHVRKQFAVMVHDQEEGAQACSSEISRRVILRRETWLQRQFRVLRRAFGLN